MANDEINVPSLVLILVVSGLLLRHFFFRGPSSTGGAAGAAGTAGAGTARSGAHDQRRAEILDRRTEAAVEHIQQIFPYADRREVWWDLRHNGINIASTTERILAGRLDQPPISFQPPAPPTRNTSSTGTGGTGAAVAAAAAAAKSSQPSLIQRYHLQDRVGDGDEPATTLTQQPPSAPEAEQPAGPTTRQRAKVWSSNRDERQALLKKRRDDMILEARRKMEAKIAAEKNKTASSS